VTENVWGEAVDAEGRPLRSPVVERVSPDGIVALLKDVMGRVDRVVAVNCTGVISRFCTKNWADRSEMAMLSDITDRRNVWDAVAGVPTALAVIVTVDRGVTVSGIPPSCTVEGDTAESVRPVPSNPLLVKPTAFPDALVA
jgi:hypothetical protein